MRLLLGSALLALTLCGCPVDVSGAPCSSNESCPTGQHCGPESKCVPGEGATGGGAGGGTGGGSSAGGGAGAGTAGGGSAGGGGGTVSTACVSTAECEAVLGNAGSSPAGCAEALCNTSTGACEFRARDADSDGERAAACVAEGLSVTHGADCDDSNATVKAGTSIPCTTSEEDGGALFPTTPPVGQCVAPTRTCDVGGSGQYSACTGGVLPAAQQCSSAEDFDCNGRPDSDDCGCQEGTTRPCFPSDAGTAGVGRCTNGTETCVLVDAGLSAWGSCTGAVVATPEICNGIDDDCDSTVDQPPATGSICPIGGQSCSAGVCGCASNQSVCGENCANNTCVVGIGACRRTGALVCTGVDAGCSVTAGTPATEIPCNGTDENCDGADSTTCPNTGQSCSAGSCQCPSGQQACSGACRAYGSSCTTGVGACLRSGTNTVCGASSFTCNATAGQPATEIPCNGTDENCDGVASQTCATPGQVCTSGSCQCPSGQQVCGGACRSYGTGCTVGTGSCQRSGTNTVCNGSTYTCNVTAAAPGREVECNGADEDCNGVASGACSQGGGDDGSSCVQRRYPLDLPDQWYGDWAEGGQTFSIGTMPSFTGANRVDLYFRTLRPGTGNGSCCGTNAGLTVAEIYCDGALKMTLTENDFPTGGVQRVVTTTPGANCQMVFYNNGNTCCCGCNRIFDSWDAYAYGPRCRTL